MIVNVSASYVSAVFLFQHVSFSFCEAICEDTQCGMTKVNEKYVPVILRVEISLPEHPIVQSDGS